MNAPAAVRAACMPGIDEFESLEFDAEAFDHQAHVYVGWQLVRRYDPTTAALRFTETLKRLVRQLGADGKYNETVSWFFMLLIAERQALQQHDSWPDFRRDNPDLVGHAGELLSRHYDPERL